MRYLYGAAAVVWGLTFLVVANLAFAKRPGIFPIGENAVYIENSACTVNMTPDRSEEDILADMVECIELHRQHR